MSAAESAPQGPRAQVVGDCGATVERIAKAFHDTYELLAPHFNYETRRASAVPWDDVPANNKGLMRAVVNDLISQGVIHVPTD